MTTEEILTEETWQDKKYRETFDEEVRGIQSRLAHDPQCRIADLEGILRGLYANQGADWLGRGEVQDIILNATIAAYEKVIAEEQKKAG